MRAGTLESALAKIAADNNLTTVDVGRMPVDDRVVWTARVHWVGYSRRNISCAAGNSDKSIREAVFAALVAAASDRTPDAAMPAEMPALKMAEAA